MQNQKKLYSCNGNEPQYLPDTIYITEGWGAISPRTNVETFTDEELKKSGYTGPYENPSINIEYQTKYWDSEKLSYVIEDISDEILWEKIREKRNFLLSKSDWTMCADIPGKINLAEWMKHRQRLRDITSQDLDPKKVVWPLSPDEHKDFDLDPIVEPTIRFRIEDLEHMVKTIIKEVFPSVDPDIVLPPQINILTKEVLPNVDPNKVLPSQIDI